MNWEKKLQHLLWAFNNSHRERLVFHSIQYANGWLAASDLFHVFTQAIKFYTFHYEYRCLKNVIHQIDSKNGWVLLAASFTAKFGLVFVLTLENAFSWRFHFQANRKRIGSSKKRYYGFSKWSSVGKIDMFLCDDQWKFLVL